MLADLRHELRDRVVIASLTGEIDMSNAHHLRGGLTSLTPNEALGLVLDLTDVEYLDSAGIHMIFRLRDSLRVRGQTLAMVIPESSPLRDTLRLAGVPPEQDVMVDVGEAERLVRGAEGPP